MGVFLYMYYSLSLAWIEILNGHEIRNVLPNPAAVFQYILLQQQKQSAFWFRLCGKEEYLNMLYQTEAQHNCKMQKLFSFYFRPGNPFCNGAHHFAKRL